MQKNVDSAEMKELENFFCRKISQGKEDRSNYSPHNKTTKVHSTLSLAQTATAADIKTLSTISDSGRKMTSKSWKQIFCVWSAGQTKFESRRTLDHFGP